MLFKKKSVQSAVAMRNRILIYNDSGTCDIRPLKEKLEEHFGAGVEVKTVTADEIIRENALNEQVLAFFMPGGRATPYLEKLKVRGNRKIADYVNNGGVYFGICAGAYYASRNVFFEADIKELAVVQQCGLNLIDADAIGTLHREFGISPFANDFTSVAAAKVLWCADNELHIASYHGGPYFKPAAENNVQILAEYELDGQRLPAAVMQRHGLGVAIVSGLHIEDTGRHLRSIIRELGVDVPAANRTAFALEKGENSRQALFGKMMEKIKHRR